MSFSTSKWFILLGGLVVLGHQIWLHVRFPPRETVRKPSTWQQFLSLLSVSLGIFCVVLLLYNLGHLNMDRFRWAGVWRTVGLLLFLGGGVVRIWSLNSLQENYAPDLRIKSGGHLVSTGAYSWVRHPFYLSVMLFAFGAGIALENLIVLGLAVSLIWIVQHRIRLEEEMLLDHFGEKYLHYQEQVPALFPRYPKPEYKPYSEHSAE